MTVKCLIYLRIVLHETVMYVAIVTDNVLSCMFRKFKEIWARLASAIDTRIQGMEFLTWE